MFSHQLPIRTFLPPFYMRGIREILELCLRLINSKELPRPQLAYFLDTVYKALLEPYGNKLVPPATEAIIYLAAYLETLAKEGLFSRVVVTDENKTRCLAIPQRESTAWPEASFRPR